MKKVTKSPMVIEVLNIPNAQRSLERLADLLAKIQKALGKSLPGSHWLMAPQASILNVSVPRSHGSTL